MVKFETVLTEASSLVKAIIATFALVGALSAFYVGATKMLSIPGKLDQHSTASAAGVAALNNTLDKILCITIADHRKLNWNLCFINPSEVVPIDGSH